MSNTITSVNAVFMLRVEGLFDTPQQIQNFIADDLFDFGQIANKEIMLGADGTMVAGWLPSTVPMNIALLPSGADVYVFEQWYLAEQALRDTYYAQATVALATGKTYECRKGVLQGYSPAPDAKKTLMPRKFTIVWQSIVPSAQLL